MISLSQFTSPDAVRAALGVADEEITNQDIALPMYEQVLQLDLYELETTMADYFLGMPVDISARSAAQTRFADLMNLYSCYVVAKHLLISLSMFAPKLIKDSKTELERVIDPYAQTREGVRGFYHSLQAKLLAAYIALVPSVVAPKVVKFTSMFSVPGGTDPVTGA